MTLTTDTTFAEAYNSLREIEKHLVKLYTSGKRIKALEIIKEHIHTANAVGGSAGVMISARLKIVRAMIANQTLIVDKRSNDEQLKECA